MYTFQELVDIVPEAELAYISAEFFSNIKNLPNPTNMYNNSQHPVWRELLIYQNAWLASKKHIQKEINELIFS